MRYQPDTKTGCSYGGVATGEGVERAMRPYRIMGEALRAQDRDIVFSICQYGKDDVCTWGAKVGGQSWRTTGDVFALSRYSASGEVPR